jgi:hypothetical protein
MDFVIPLHRYHSMIRTTVEGIYQFYSPNKIYIITPEKYVKNIYLSCSDWNTTVIPIAEETFFINNYGLHINDIKRLFNNKEDSRSREFGWWYQQIIKLSAYTQIDGLSDPYVVWDSDLIPLIKWDLYSYEPALEEHVYKFAILQEKARTEWNIDQYRESIQCLTGLNTVEPNEGTFVPHHFIFHHFILAKLKEHIESHNNNNNNWIHCIMDLSHYFFRFSEYKMVATFMINYFPEMLHYYEYNKYGKFGNRIREPQQLIREIEENCVIESYGLSYDEFCKFINKKYDYNISYLQIEHI